MTFYTKPLDNCVVLQTNTSSPGGDWAVVSDVQTAINQARSQGVPLFVRPGVYSTSAITVDSSEGGGQMLAISCLPGTASFQLTSGDNLLAVQGISCRIEGLIFDGDNVTFSNLQDSSALLKLDAAPNANIAGCAFQNSVACGIYVPGGSIARIAHCAFNNCNYGLWALDSTIMADSNNVENCANNGIMVWTSTVTGNSSSITNNFINTIGSQSGTGQNGNGINVFRAVAVNIIGNRFNACQYSSIRCNGGGDAIIIGNNCYNSREMAIFLEAPTQGVNFTGAVVVGNMIDNAGNGISVADSGQSGLGIARSVAITGNRITNVVNRIIDDPGYVPTVSIGFGIYTEGACVVSGNLVDTAAGIGIVAGHNASTADLNISSNLVVNSPIGVGYSDQAGAGQIVISGNQIQGANGGGVVSVVFDDSTGTMSRESGSQDYGNQYDSQIGNVLFGNNRSY